MSKGTDVNAGDRGGATPLHVAAEKGRKEVVEVLIAKGADVNAKDSDGSRPLRLGTKEGKKDVAELLRKHGGRE